MKQDFFLFGICTKLAWNGIVVVLKSRNEKRGLEAVERLKEFGLSDFVVFHQLDVTDPSSVTSLSHFIKTRFGKLDILVNNAGVHGGIINAENYLRRVRFHDILYQNYELAKECVETDFFGAERVTKVLLSLVQLSTSPRIVNISGQIRLLKIALDDGSLCGARQRQKPTTAPPTKSLDQVPSTQNKLEITNPQRRNQPTTNPSPRLPKPGRTVKEPPMLQSSNREREGRN
ncbi:(+)-neomenthol dehydrogenase-like [Vigna umbellata]|uniref:(+)-neomenthol dehydrogenase-like n=1 Tax=Vigna umbellata TaxID=87088 RepID=UPI001F5E5025|nr:(+)-neomenthol dehydrogenase-like [Vigna umbellata]